MIIISKSILNDYCAKHPDTYEPILNWCQESRKSNWRNFSDLKKSFNSADNVGNDRYVFNTKGNHYRIVALIIFKVRTVFILFIGTHKDYDKIDASSITYQKR